jgi:hypothetical protein
MRGDIADVVVVTVRWSGDTGEVHRCAVAFFKRDSIWAELGRPRIAGEWFAATIGRPATSRPQRGRPDTVTVKSFRSNPNDSAVVHALALEHSPKPDSTFVRRVVIRGDTPT